MKEYVLNDLDDEQIGRLCKRPGMDFASVLDQVRPIIRAVRDDGDAAVKKFTRMYDGVETEPLFIEPDKIPVHLADEERHALDTAMRNVQRFHMEQARGELQVETMPGITCRRVMRPIENVGLYIPGGSAPLPSTAVMLGVPAAAAGCKTIIFATPPDKNGQVPPSIAYVAQKTGAAGILKAGGAQAVAAMAYGTESVPPADKIFGPGNQYVTAAKMFLQNSDAMVSIDLPAGPSEVLVIAGGNADPDFIAADLLSQAEHGADSQVVLVTLPGFDLDQLRESLKSQTRDLSRADIVRSALDHSFTVTAENITDALAFSNKYAPEHLILNLDNAESLIGSIRHAGSVFLGACTPESLGDYASGTNHTLPTYGYARMYSGVSLDSFQKSITFQKATEAGLQTLGPVVEKLADMEGLDAHRQAVSVRLKKIRGRPDSETGK
ncbi:MAG: histidinol dehydrogenase [Balneolaceae bacterium]